MTDIAKPRDGWAKLMLAGLAIYFVDHFGRQGAYPAAFVPSNAIPAIINGTAEWFSALGVLAPVAALVVLFVLDGIFSNRR